VITKTGAMPRFFLPSLLLSLSFARVRDT